MKYRALVTLSACAVAGLAVYRMGRSLLSRRPVSPAASSVESLFI